MTTEKTAVLDSFSPETRAAALNALAAGTFPEPGANFNMHCHSFFSYNADGWSPSRVAYECRSRGLCAAALCDFDVLDGLEEFLAAGRLLALRAAVHLETRAYVPELAACDISSPGEPGVTYIMGCGFVREPASGTPQAATLAALRQGAQARNLALIARVNAALPAIAIDYARDVLPLTPQGVATERHIVRAYRAQAEKVFADAAARAAFWAPLLACDAAAYPALETALPKLEDQIRNALAKRGGIGYIQPDEKTFPLADDFTRWVKACDAIPTIAWLDGTSGGEADAGRLLDLMTAKGCAALNIIPDRNWNLKRPDEAAAKQAKLAEIIAGCVVRNLPVNIGTEMNKGGLPFVDELAGPVLNRYVTVFVQGMQVMVGQSVLARYADAPYLGARAATEFPDLARRNAFYAAVGALPALTEQAAARLQDAGPDKAFSLLADAARCA
ncbi:MAG: hypothetical protein WC328_10270 [Kiritimatiellia bacterium]|jgi:hypothetical protein|nr:hypothetical protein [Kiritimatiellia bacterium]MDD4173916.1 hypothetical protein [Kiritimatiellia bacterium]MDD4442864.1 hypothetical protein [Kiritimatiellia bacterium]MDX9792450.1 hypothetical protein [Kiritimatiellia bacterium]NLC82405.1 hypothetical protein [Lentisphaerota bacterium]